MLDAIDYRIKPDTRLKSGKLCIVESMKKLYVEGVISHDFRVSNLVRGSDGVYYKHGMQEKE